MNQHVKFELGERTKTISVSVADPVEAIKIVKAMFPSGKDFRSSEAEPEVARPLPLSAPPEQVKEAEKPKIIKP
jgi:hypothetical protein